MEGICLSPTNYTKYQNIHRGKINRKYRYLTLRAAQYEGEKTEITN